MNYQVFETVKMKVELGDDHIIKTFKPAYGSKKRYEAEKEALQILKNVQGIPEIIEINDDIPFIKMTRLPGKPVNQLSVKEALGVKTIITAVLEKGVARHSLPVRDILSDESENVGIVDFERVTIRKNSNPITWHIAKKVAFFHLARLLFEHQPSLLSKKDQVAVATGFKVRAIFKKYMGARDAVRNFYRMLVNPVRDSM
ncbi:hypothetical protein BH23BAC2_BH23BAC2_20900 [soil metagenome]